jgi:hypothetical protein
MNAMSERKSPFKNNLHRDENVTAPSALTAPDSRIKTSESGKLPKSLGRL